MATSDWAIPAGKTITGATYIKDTDDNIAATIEDLVDWCNNANGAYNDWTLTGLRTDFVDIQSAQTITGAKTFSTNIAATGGVTGNVTGSLTGNSDTATTLTGLTSTVTELNKLDGYTGGVTDLNYLASLYATGVTSTEYDYLDGVTSNIQTQFTGKASLTGATFTGQVKGITPVAAEDLTRKDYVDGIVVSYTDEAILLAINWKLDTASYDSVSFSVTTQDSGPRGVFFKDDGTKMYIAGSATNSIYQYSLSTAWDLSTASYDSVAFSIVAQDSGLISIFFKDDGTKMYMTGTNTNTVYQYSLSTAWDLSTISYDSVSFSAATQDTIVRGLSIKDDGTKMYIAGDTNDSIYQYTLSTPWDLSTAAYDSVSFSAATQDTGVHGVFFKADGKKMYIVGAANDTIYQYALSTAWDLSTASYDSISKSVATEDGTPSGIFFRPNGTKLYLMGGLTDTVYQYSTGY